MAFINVGAFVNGARPASKKALKEAIKNAPDTVTFDGTSALPGTPGAGQTYRASALPEGDTLSITGPDPYRARNWYANVKRSAGKVTVS